MPSGFHCVVPLQTLSASTETLPASTETLSASTETLPASTETLPASTETLPASVCSAVRADLLVLGDGIQQLDVQLRVVLGQGLVAVVVDQLHHRAERQRVREAVLSVPMEDFDQLVIASFPVKII